MAKNIKRFMKPKIWAEWVLMTIMMMLVYKYSYFLIEKIFFPTTGIVITGQFILILLSVIIVDTITDTMFDV